MRLYSIDGIPVKEKIDVKCDNCSTIWKQRLNSNKASRKRRKSNLDYCAKCSAKMAAKTRPQNQKEYWSSPEKRKAHGHIIKTSDQYYIGIQNRPSIEGPDNPMWGKNHTIETRRKMSLSRTGKTGENATAWKGGKCSINKRVKGAVQRKHKWFHRVIERDNKTCQECGDNSKLDAHHIVPISTIISNLLQNYNSPDASESDKIEWLMKQPEIIDNDLTNGVTLCRMCHKKIHRKWGSHNAKIK